MKNIAVILAGGSGKRLGDNIPKQFIKIAGKKVVEHTIDVFENHPLINEIVIVCHKDYILDLEAIVIDNCYSKVAKILSGGKERSDSSLVAINAYKEDVNLIFHDSVRPLINPRIITDCIKALGKYNAVDVAIPTTDTIIQVKEDMTIQSVPKRSQLYNGQTPQAFKKSIIQKAYELALKDPHFQATDDCGVIIKYLPEESVFVVKGDLSNMKLTYKEDVFLLDKLFQLSTMIGEKEILTSFTIKNLIDKVVVVFGGSSGIGEEIVKLLTDNGVKVYSFSRSNGCDITKSEDIKKALEFVYKDQKHIDYVINSVGYLSKQPLATMSLNAVLELININYTGALLIAKESFKYLRESKGILLFFTSSSYTRGRAMYSIYSSSKAAIVNLTQALSEEWASFGIKVNCINPERTKTPMRTVNFGNEPEGSLLSAREVAISTLNTLSSGLNGQIIDVKIS